MARERYLLHAGEDTIHRPGEDRRPEGPKEKWGDFWYYHKWHMLIVAAVLLAASFLLSDLFSRVSPDYEIGLVTETAVPEETVRALEQAFAQYGRDRNSDGKTVVRVNAYPLAPGETGQDPQVRAASVVRLSADLSEGTSMIFLTDDASFRARLAQGAVFAYTDGTTPPETGADDARMRVALKDCRGLPGSLSKLPLSVSLRAFEGTELAGKPEKAAYFTDSRELFRRISAGR